MKKKVLFNLTLSVPAKRKRAINILDMYYGVIDLEKFESDGPESIRSLTRPILCYN